jgi:hypothetical protein
MLKIYNIKKSNYIDTNNFIKNIKSFDPLKRVSELNNICIKDNINVQLNVADDKHEYWNCINVYVNNTVINGEDFYIENNNICIFNY